MTVDELIELLLTSFCGNFAVKTVNTVIRENAVKQLYGLATRCPSIDMPAAKRDMLAFRSAYILETVYKLYPEYFEPYKERFFGDFVNAFTGSAKRHFCNIMSDLLDYDKPEAETSQAIAEACLNWITAPKVKPAVKIKGTEILIKLMDTASWIKEALPSIIEETVVSPQPSTAAAVRKWKQKGWLAEIYK